MSDRKTKPGCTSKIITDIPIQLMDQVKELAKAAGLNTRAYIVTLMWKAVNDAKDQRQEQ